MSDLTAVIPEDGDSVGMRSSSLVGITTAIVGNVVISIALNLQRYAHLKLKKESATEAALYNAGPSGEYEGHNDEELAYDADDETAFRDLELGPDVIRQVQDAEHRYHYDTILRLEQSTSVSPVIPGSPATYDNSSITNKSNEGDVRLLETNKQGTMWYSSKNAKGNKNGRLPQSDTLQSTTSVGGSTERLPRYMKSGYWWLGIALMAIGETGNFLAYGFAPASTVSPLGVVALISNCIVAPIFFHERIRSRDLVGVVVAIAGAVTVVFASNPEEEFLDPQRILNAVTQMSFEIYVGVTLFLMVVLGVLSNKYGERLIFIDIALVALFGGYTALSTKAVSSLLSYTLYRVFTFPITYLLVFILIFTAIMQVKYLSRALQRFESTQVIPTHFVFFTISVILGSAILYQDFYGASSAQLAQFFFGCLLTFIGVSLITSNRKNEDDVGGKSARHVDSDDSEFFSTVASVNLDRSSGARTPTSFYEEDEDAQEINDANATVNARTRANPLIRDDDIAQSGGNAIPSSEISPLLSFWTPSKYGSSPGTSSRSYVPGPAGMGLIMDSVVRDRMKSWQNQQRRRHVESSALSSGRRRTASKSTTIDSRNAPLYRVQTRDDEEY
ncbi:magnesium transporter NIPA-domain-containing protein [Lipomyces mesembrius]